MSKEISKMTNKELDAYCKSNGINVDSKNVSKPTQKEFLEAISAFKISQNSDDTIDNIYIEDEGITDNNMNDVESIDDFLNIENENPVALKQSPEQEKQTRAKKRKQQYDELMVLRRVIINSNNNSQTQAKNQVHYCTWGNRLLGHNTDRFVTGKPWHVREGALRNLEAMEISNPIQDDDGNTIKFEKTKAYIIQRLDPLSMDEIQTIGKRQIIRDSSIENVI